MNNLIEFQDNTSSPASSYKDSSSVAYISLIIHIIHVTWVKKNEIKWNDWSSEAQTCNNRRAQYWLTAGPSSLAITCYNWNEMNLIILVYVDLGSHHQFACRNKELLNFVKQAP